MLVSVSVVVKGFDSDKPTFRAREAREFLREDQMLPCDDGDIATMAYLDTPERVVPPFGHMVYGLAIGKADAYPCVSLNLHEGAALKELEWWRQNHGPGVARFMKPAVLEPAPALEGGLLAMSLLDMARESQAPEEGTGFFAAWPRSGKWRGVRDAHLAKHPACEACGDTRMLNVHHVQPFHLFPDLELDPGNLITLCEIPSHACHFAIGHAFDWRSYNPHVREDAARMMERVRTRKAA